jgi:RNA polymerase sigma-70 factor (ECF subfamily)
MARAVRARSAKNSVGIQGVIRTIRQVTCSNGHHAFVQHLFERYRVSLVRYVAGLLGTHTDAEDIVQETCTRLLRVDDLEHDEARARSYMFKVATNLAYDRHRKRREQSIEDVGASAESLTAIDGPDAMVDLDRAMQAITQVLLQLKPRCRQVFLLRTAEGLSFEAIAERLGISQRSVERDMKHALDACQRRLNRLAE